MDTLRLDVRYALRQLAKHPGLAVTAVLSLALGIGANTALFQIAERALFRPLAVAEPERLVAVVDGERATGRVWENSYRELAAYREANAGARVFAALVASNDLWVGLGGADAEMRVNASVVSPGYFALLGVPAALGRTLRNAPAAGAMYDAGTGETEVVLSDRLWRRAFGANPAVVGTTVRLNKVPFTVVGVAPRSFGGLSLGGATDAWVPLGALPVLSTGPATASEYFGTANDYSRWLRITARLAPGATREQAEAFLLAVRRRIAPPGDYGPRGPVVSAIPAADAAVLSGGDDLRRFVVLLVGVVGLTLLIACANLATLLLARSASRAQEIGVRVAMGAGRGRLMRQLFTESAVLSGLGALAGFVIAAWTGDLLAPFALPGGVSLESVTPELGLGTIGIALALAVVTSILVGLAPAVAATRRAPASVLQARATTESAGQSRLRGWLVGAQVALALVLLCGAGVFGRSLRNALALDTGFRTDDVALVGFHLGEQRYTAERARTFYAQLVERARALPGVRGAALARVVPVDVGGGRTSLYKDVAEGGDHDHPLGEFAFNIVGEGYFGTMGIALVRGRDFTRAEAEMDSLHWVPRAIVVNETLAKRFWPGQDPLGKRLYDDDPATTPGWTVVGVVRDSKYRGLREEAQPYFYYPLGQRFGWTGLARMNLVFRTGADLDRTLGDAVGLVHALDRELPVYKAETMREHLSELVMPQRTGVAVLGLLSLIGIVLAVTGIYGVAAYAVARRTREIGVRIALGARPADVVRLVLGQGMLAVALGVAGGLVLVAAAGKLAASFMYGVRPSDPLTLAAAALLLGGAGLVAMLVPARRATRIQAIEALRSE